MGDLSVTFPIMKELLGSYIEKEPITKKDLIEKCDQIFKIFVKNLQNTLQKKQFSQADRASILGRYTKFLQVMDDMVSERLGEAPLHRYCCCHITEKGKKIEDQLKTKWPLLQDKKNIRWTSYPAMTQLSDPLKGCSATLFSWSLGEGHNVVQDASAKRLAERGMHIYKIDSYQEILKKFDLLYFLTFGVFTTGDLINFLMRNNWWTLLNFLNWWFGGGKPSSPDGLLHEFMQALKKRGDSDLVISCFDRYLNIIDKAAHRLGRPLLSIATDFDPSLTCFSAPRNIQSKRLIRGIMVPPAQDAPIADGLKKMIGGARVRYSGLTVREAFLRKRSSKELVELRKKWNVAPDTQVVVILGGGQGVRNEYSEAIAKYYQQQEKKEDLPKIHLFVVTGKNREQKKHLDKFFAPFKHPQIQATILGWQGEGPLAELFAMGAQEGKNGFKGVLLSAKGGGGTLSDGVASGIPILVCDRSPISWEKRNIQFICDHKLGEKFEKKREMIPELLGLLKTPYKPLIDYQSQNFKKLFFDLVEELLLSSASKSKEKPQEKLQEILQQPYNKAKGGSRRSSHGEAWIRQVADSGKLLRL